MGGSCINAHRNREAERGGALLTPVGEPAALAKAIRRVLDDDELRRAPVAGGRRRADVLSMGRLADRYVEIYEALLAGRRDPGRTGWRHLPRAEPRVNTILWNLLARVFFRGIYILVPH